MDQCRYRSGLLHPLPPRNIQGVQRCGGGENFGEDKKEAQRNRRRGEQRQVEEARLLDRGYHGVQLLLVPGELRDSGNVRISA